MTEPTLIPVAEARDKWDDQDHDMLVRQLRRLDEQRAGLFPFWTGGGVQGPQAWVDRNIYSLNWSAEQVLIELDFVSTDRHGETHAEIAVYWSDPLDPMAVVRTRISLSNLLSRDRLATAIGKRTPALKLDWQRMLDQAVRWTMEQYRSGDPGLLLRDAEEIAPGSDVLTDPPLLEGDGLSILFGDGGTGKSWIALALAASLQSAESVIDGITVPNGRRVGYIDWEWSARRHRRRLMQLTGPDMPDLAYIRCSRSIFEERDRLRRWARRFGIDYAIVDSVGLACGAEPESAEIANRFVNALFDLVPAALGIAHVTKAAADRPPDKPFGSTYWHNGARRTWYARRVGEPGASGMTLGLYNRKANDGPLAAPFALNFDWVGERVAIRRQDVREIPELDNARSIPARMRDLLGRQGAMQLHAIAEELGEKVDSVRRVAYRGKVDGRFVNFAGPDGIYRWAVKQEEV